MVPTKVKSVSKYNPQAVPVAARYRDLGWRHHDAPYASMPDQSKPSDL